MGRRLAAALVLLAACRSSDELVLAADDPCGDERPRAVLELEPGERLARLSETASRLVLTLERDEDNGDADGDGDGHDLEARLVSVDRCGDDAVTLPGSVLADSDEDDDVVIVCDEANGQVDVVRADGTMRTEGVLEGVECEVARTGASLLAILRDAPSIVAVPIEGGQARVLVDALAPGPVLPAAVHDGTLFALTAQGVLVERAVGEGGDYRIVSEREGVAAFSLSPDGTQMVVQLGPPGAEEPGSVRWTWRGGDEGDEPPDGGEAERELLQASLRWSPLPWLDDFVMLADAPTAPRRLFLAGKEVTLPPATVLRGTIPDGRLWVGQAGLPYGELHESAWDRERDATTMLYEGEGFASRGDDGLYVLQPSEDHGIQRGALVEVPWSGEAPTVVADEVGWNRRRLEGARWLSVVTSGEGDWGELRLHQAGESTRLLDEVHVHSAALARLVDEGVYASTPGALVRVPLGED